MAGGTEGLGGYPHACHPELRVGPEYGTKLYAQYAKREEPRYL